MTRFALEQTVDKLFVEQAEIFRRDDGEGCVVAALQKSSMTAQILLFALELKNHRERVDVAASMHRSAVNVKSIRVDQDQHRNVCNRGHVDELLKTIVDKALVDQEVVNPLQNVQHQVHHRTNGYFKENIVVDDIIGFTFHRV